MGRSFEQPARARRNAVKSVARGSADLRLKRRRQETTWASDEKMAVELRGRGYFHITE